MSMPPMTPCRPGHAMAMVVVLRSLSDHHFGGQQQADTEAEFCSARRVTLVGSRMPASIMSPNTPVAAL